MAAWARICWRVSFAVSPAKSVSRMTDSAAAVFSSVIPRLLMVDPTVFRWNAPSRPRRLETCRMAESTIVCPFVRSPFMTLAAPPDLSAERNPFVESPMTGTVWKMLVEPGQEVASGEVLCIVEAMKMEFAIEAPRDVVVDEVKCAAGERVDIGDVLVTFRQDD